MYSLCFLILCSLLQAGSESSVPKNAERLPAVVPKPFIPAAPVQTVPLTPPNNVPPVVAAPPIPQPQTTRNPKQFVKKGALTLPERNDVTLSAPERAVIMLLRTEQRDADGKILLDESGTPITVPLREGMYVFKEQILGNFDDRELRSTLKINQAQLEVAIAEQNNKTERNYAAESLRVAIADYQMLIDVNKQHANTASATEIRRAALVQEQAYANLDMQKYTLEEIKTREITVRKNELERTKVQIEQRQLRSPIDGMIVQINAAEGELVREGDPVLNIVQLDTLWVSVNVDVLEYDARDLDGKQATISVVLANGQTESFPGVVVFCNPRILVEGSYKILIEVQNRRVGNYWLLQPGRNDVNVVIPME